MMTEQIWPIYAIAANAARIDLGATSVSVEIGPEGLSEDRLREIAADLGWMRPQDESVHRIIDGTDRNAWLRFFADIDERVTVSLQSEPRPATAEELASLNGREYSIEPE